MPPAGTKFSSKEACDGQATLNPEHLVTKTAFSTSVAVSSFAMHRNLTDFVHPVLFATPWDKFSFLNRFFRNFWLQDHVVCTHRVLALSSQQESLCSVFSGRWPGQSLQDNATHWWQEQIWCHAFIYSRKTSPSFVVSMMADGSFCGYCVCSFCFLCCVLFCLAVCVLLEVCVFYGSYIIYGMQPFMVFITLPLVSVRSKIMPLLPQF